MDGLLLFFLLLFQEQYKFIYDAVLAYLESFEEFQYENFKMKSWTGGLRS